MADDCAEYLLHGQELSDSDFKTLNSFSSLKEGGRALKNCGESISSSYWLGAKT